MCEAGEITAGNQMTRVLPSGLIWKSGHVTNQCHPRKLGSATVQCSWPPCFLTPSQPQVSCSLSQLLSHTHLQENCLLRGCYVHCPSPSPGNNHFGSVLSTCWAPWRQATSVLFISFLYIVSYTLLQLTKCLLDAKKYLKFKKLFQTYKKLWKKIHKTPLHSDSLNSNILCMFLCICIHNTYKIHMYIKYTCVYKIIFSEPFETKLQISYPFTPRYFRVYYLKTSAFP